MVESLGRTMGLQADGGGRVSWKDHGPTGGWRWSCHLEGPWAYRRMEVVVSLGRTMDLQVDGGGRVSWKDHGPTGGWRWSCILEGPWAYR